MAVTVPLPAAGRAYELKWSEATLQWDDEIGHGTAGRVYPATIRGADDGVGPLVAKVITLNGEEEIEALPRVLAEVDLHYNIKHARVVRVLAVAVQDNAHAVTERRRVRVAVFMDRMDGTLEAVLKAIARAAVGAGVNVGIPTSNAEWSRRLDLATQVSAPRNARRRQYMCVQLSSCKPLRPCPAVRDRH